MAIRGRREISPGVLLLAYQIMSLGFDNIPPVTLLTVAAQTVIFMGFIPSLDQYSIREICVLPNRIWYSKEWKRLLFSSIVHGDDMHLYYNMVSFLWKGRRLERKFGSYYFAYLLAAFSIFTNVVLVSLSLFVDEIWQLGLCQQCAVGFSGVIFALKVLCNHYFPHEDAYVLGWLPVPSQYACWAELLLIQVLVPNASFVGHLAGILVGLAYVQGPLKWLLDGSFNAVSSRSGSREHAGWEPRGNTRRPFQAGREGGYGYGQADNAFAGYTGGLSEEEQLRRAMDESINGVTRRRARPWTPSETGHGRLYPDIN